VKRVSLKTTVDNHIIGLPEKNGVDKPLYDYVKIIFDAQNGNANSPNKKHLWIKKATGLDNSQFMLRFMTWQIYNYIYMYIIYCHNYDNR
jgi:hypothetical protein